MKQYHSALVEVLSRGVRKSDRTGTGTISAFGLQHRYPLNPLPVITTKKVHLKSVIHELLWFISGDTNIGYLKRNGVRIWDEWADVNGDLGPIYGAQWRSWVGPDGKKIDQLHNLVVGLVNDPDSRRHIISSWNVGAICDMALPPCHCFLQFHVSNGTLSCQLYQRSADMFLGVPFNISSYAIFTHMLAQVTGYAPGEFVHTIGDAHIYLNHLEQVEELLSREPMDLPTIELNPSIRRIIDFKYDDIRVLDYKSHPSIPGKVAV